MKTKNAHGWRIDQRRASGGLAHPACVEHVPQVAPQVRAVGGADARSVPPHGKKVAQSHHLGVCLGAANPMINSGASGSLYLNVNNRMAGNRPESQRRMTEAEPLGMTSIHIPRAVCSPGRWRDGGGRLRDLCVLG
ncbi:hypothetical protein I7I51_04866 [Histoplasma capsulatum]|uniref:Uncharacterized protein n=1 Tax=Ajellomyces capsulatus TaxID=5037 RepID=A0A8A1M400_AJECA|nr:hypothetical protein I7I51_04866 [Histoplasma capsulatum]